MTPAWGLSAIAWILDFCGAKIRANKKREKAAKIRAERKKKKEAKAAAKKARLIATREEYAREEKARKEKARLAELARQAESDRINAENAKIFEAANVPVDEDPYGEGE